MKYKNDAGRSMMEMILYLGLMIVIGTSTITMYMNSVEKTRNIQAESLISDLVEKVNTYYLGRDFPMTGNITSTLKNKMKDQINLIDPWGTKILVHANKNGNGANDNSVYAKPYFGLEFSNLDKKRCITIYNLLTQKDAGMVEINGTKVLDLGLAAQSCKPNSNKVVGLFKKN